ncbi:MAG: sulfotransferase [Actinomycetota bacterium]
MSRRPILVTGSHRSGTTWVGEMLAASGEVVPIHEPFNPELSSSWLAAPPPRWYHHVGPEGDDLLAADLSRVAALKPAAGAMLRRSGSPRDAARVGREAIRAVSGRLRGRRALLKDPIAFFSAPWIHTELEADVVVLVRHPAAFAGSLARLGWAFDFTNLTDQPSLIDGPAAPFADELAAAAVEPGDIIDQAILLWRLIAHVAAEYAVAHPSWTVRRYEDLAAEPTIAVPELARAVGLRWSDAATDAVAELTSSQLGAHVADGDKGGVARDSRAAMWTWLDRLDPEHVRRVRAGTADIAERFYGDSDWAPPTTTSTFDPRP